MPVMDKQLLVQRLISILEEEIHTSQAAAEDARQRANESEGRMQSRYDTHKEEQGQLASAMAARTSAKVQFLSLLRGTRIEPLIMRPVQEGSLVRFYSDKQRQELWIFIISGGGGFETEIDGVKVLCVAPNAPMPAKMMGKIPGDEIKNIAPGLGDIEILYTE